MPLAVDIPSVALILDSISDGVYVTSEDRRIVYWNKGAERITGFTAEQVVGSHCHDNILMHTDIDGRQLCFSGCPLAECMRTGVPGMVREVLLERADGMRLAVYVKTATFESNGKTYGVEVFGELEGLAGKDLAAQVQHLTDASITDPLSGLFNRRYLDTVLEQRFCMFQQLGRRYGVVMLDVDDFKSINDTLGHAAGDDAIRFVSDVLSGNARKMDTVARYGGDEFVVVCSVADADELEAYCTRLAALVGGSHFARAHEAGLSLTISVGGALVDALDQAAASVMQRADSAMYEAKGSGGDAARVADVASLRPAV